MENSLERIYPEQQMSNLNQDECLKQIHDSFTQIGVDLSEQQMEDFFLFYQMLVEKNKVMNLTAITEFPDVLLKHFIDSASLIRVMEQLKLEQPLRIMDMGCGAGFPGIPLRIAFPHHEFVLSDSLNKRIKFIQEFIDKCRYENITAVHGRAEELAKNKVYREQFDVCTSRAVAALPVLSEYCLPFVKVGGCMAAYKSGECAQEVEDARTAVRKLGGEILPFKTFTLPGSDITRTIILIKKIAKTSSKYPRKAGTPAKDPLK